MLTTLSLRRLSVKMQETIFKDKIFWLLLIFASIYILGNIGTGSLSTWDEAIYANISRGILNTGNWLVLYDGGNPWFDKPPLYMWLTACFYRIFGINELTTRLTSGLFGIGAVLLTYIFAKRISNKNTAIFAALILLAMPHFLHSSKLGMMDAPMTFFILLMVYLFWMGQEKPQYLFLSGAVLGLAYLIKGFAAFLGPIIIVAYAVLSGQWRLPFKKQFVLGILIGLFIAFLWHMNLYLQCGPESVKDYFGFHIFARATQSVEFHRGGINFYQKAIFNKNKPWSILAYISIFYILWQAVRYKDKRAILICCWIVTAYILYTAVKTKLHWYIMPVYPAVALSSAIFLENSCQARVFKKIRARHEFSLAVILIIMLIQVPISWAFKIDFCPDVKEAANYAKELYNDGSTIYFYGGHDNKEIFYFSDFSMFMSDENAPSANTISSKKVYCVIRLDDIKHAEGKYSYIFQPVKHFDDIAIARVRNKNN